jgi:hypothetical protein
VRLGIRIRPSYQGLWIKKEAVKKKRSNFRGVVRAQEVRKAARYGNGIPPPRGE